MLREDNIANSLRTLRIGIQSNQNSMFEDSEEEEEHSLDRRPVALALTIEDAKVWRNEERVWT